MLIEKLWSRIFMGYSMLGKFNVFILFVSEKYDFNRLTKHSQHQLLFLDKGF